MKTNTQQPLKRNKTGPIAYSGKFHSAELGQCDVKCCVIKKQEVATILDFRMLHCIDNTNKYKYKILLAIN